MARIPNEYDWLNKQADNGNVERSKDWDDFLEITKTPWYKNGYVWLRSNYIALKRVPSMRVVHKIELPEVSSLDELFSEWFLKRWKSGDRSKFPGAFISISPFLNLGYLEKTPFEFSLYATPTDVFYDWKRSGHCSALATGGFNLIEREDGLLLVYGNIHYIAFFDHSAASGVPRIDSLTVVN